MRDIDKDEVGQIVYDAIQAQWHGNAIAKSPLVTKINYKDRLFLVTVSEPGSNPHPRIPASARPAFIEVVPREGFNFNA